MARVTNNDWLFVEFISLKDLNFSLHLGSIFLYYLKFFVKISILI